jgi:CheY-like chemotaxis protein
MLRVLVVDDCPETAASFCALVGVLGHEARAANDGPSALALAEGFRPDAALVNLVMPGMGGYEVARRLRAIPGLKDALLIAVSGEAEGSGRRPPRATSTSTCSSRWTPTTSPTGNRPAGETLLVRLLRYLRTEFWS